MSWDLIQGIITICGGAAIFLITRKERWGRWGYLVGLIGQPLWVYTAFQAKPLQWGILVLSVWYTYAYAQGVWFHLIRPPSEATAKEQAR